MSKVTGIKKIVVEDFPDEFRELVSKLAAVLNSFLDQVSTALNLQLTFRDNLKSQVYTLSLAAGVSTYTVAWKLNEKPTSVTIGQLRKSSGGAPSQVFCLSSLYANGSITLDFIGLDAAVAHNVTIIAQV